MSTTFPQIFCPIDSDYFHRMTCVYNVRCLTKCNANANPTTCEMQQCCETHKYSAGLTCNSMLFIITNPGEYYKNRKLKASLLFWIQAMGCNRLTASRLILAAASESHITTQLAGSHSSHTSSLLTSFTVYDSGFFRFADQSHIARCQQQSLWKSVD